MLNFAGQDIDKGHYVAQVARTSTGMKRRVGVVMGYGNENRLRVIWCSPEDEYGLSESYVVVQDLIRIDPLTLDHMVAYPLESARIRGHAKFDE